MLGELKFDENVLKNGKKEIKKNMLEALDEFLDMVADESWCAVEEIISLRKENAELREKLVKATMPPFIVIDKQTGREANIGEITKEEWASNLMRHDIYGFAITEDGNPVLLDECGNWAYCPFDRFEVVFGEEEENKA